MSKVTSLSLFLLLISSQLFIRCTHQPSKAEVQIHFQQPVTGRVSLYRLTDEKTILVDSVQLQSVQTTQFIIDIPSPSYYILRFFSNEKIYLILHPGDKIEVDIENQSEYLRYFTKGSNDCKLIRDLVFEQEKTKEQISRLSVQYEQAMAQGTITTTKRAHFDSIYNTIFDKHRNYSLSLIEQNPQSLACVFTLYQDFGIKKSLPLFDRDTYFDVFHKVDSLLTHKYPKAEAVQALNRDVARWKEQNQLISVDKKIEAGKRIPDGSFISIEGDSIHLSAFKGKKLAIIFFACWNSYSLEELSKLNRFAATSEGRNLKMLGFSLDASVDVLTQTLNKMYIRFPVVCDRLYWDSPFVQQFNVKNLPYLILIDEDGFVESNSLRINEIEAFMQN